MNCPIAIKDEKGRLHYIGVEHIAAMRLSKDGQSVKSIIELASGEVIVSNIPLDDLADMWRRACS